MIISQKQYDAYQPVTLKFTMQEDLDNLNEVLLEVVNSNATLTTQQKETVKSILVELSYYKGNKN